MKQKTLLFALLLLPMTACGQGLVKWVQAHLDSMVSKGIDPDYIELPKHPWTVEARITESNSALKMTANWDDEERDANFSLKTHNGYKPALGLKVSYRGTGIGFSKRLGSHSGTSFSFSSSSGHYGLNFRLRSFENNNVEILVASNDNGDYQEVRDHVDFESPVKVRTQFLDAYYMFNGKHYSYAATNKPGLIQRRSAGSVVAGAMYYHATVNYINNNLSNIFLNMFMLGVGKLKMTQASVGVGYAYNWVPARGWMIGAIAMPMLTFYNRTKVYRYEAEYLGDLEDEAAILLEPNEMFAVTEDGVEHTPNKVVLNYDGRLSIVRNWERFNVRLTGQYHRFRYGNEDITGWSSEWSAYLSVGYRF